MSGGLAPSKSTVYVSNLPFSLTNNDIHKIFEKYGQVVKVTILKDKGERRSRGVAFVLFLNKESAFACVQALNNTEMFGRTLKLSIAKDNGRASEFIRRKEYKDKSRCYECGEEGHLSYRCPKNLLGERQPPVKKRKQKPGEEAEATDSDSGEEGERMPTADSFSRMLQYKDKMSASSSQSSSREESVARKKYKKDAYFSDEEELDG